MPIFAVTYTYSEATIPGRDTHRPAHRAWLRELADEGTLLTVGAFTDGTGALILCRADSVDTLEELLPKDPFAIENLIERTEVREWNPVIGTFAE